MSSNVVLPQLPNPLTPMAFLPPDLAYQVTVAIYIFVGSLGVMIWDVINNLKGDYILLTKYRITWPTVTYVISRLGSLGFILASTIFETAPVGHCVSFEKGLDWLYPIAVPSTSLLFFFRVRAIFDKDIYIVTFFAFMWFAVLAGCLTVTQGITGSSIGPTNYCINTNLEAYVAAAAIIPLVNDTLVFLAISWRLMMNSSAENTLKGGVRTLVFGDYMPAFSRALLHDGQIYYLTTVSTSLLTVIMLYVSSVPIAYRTMFTVPNVMLMNIMACRVYRNTKFGIFRADTISVGKLTSKDNRLSVIPLSFTGSSRGKVPVTDRTVLEMEGIDVTKTVERVHDYPSDNKDERYLSGGSGMYQTTGSDLSPVESSGQIEV